MVEVEEVNEEGDIQRRSMVSSYEDAYTAQLQELYQCFINGKTIKTSVEDASQDPELCRLMYQAWNKSK